MKIKFLMLGDGAFTIEFPELQGVAGARQVRLLGSRIEKKVKQGLLAGIVDVISATRSLTVCVDPLKADFLKVRDAVLKVVQEPLGDKLSVGQLWTLPACYHGQYAPDMDYIAEQSGLRSNDVIKLHSNQTYDILQIGFVPGFPYMSGVSKKIRFPRRANPRLRVPAGSVAIVNDQTAIYPWESPGGWHLIGRCPVPLFNPDWAQPSLLSAGERVRFEAVSAEDFKTIENDLATGRLSPTLFGSGKKH